jgi:hypothetical protein
MVCICLMAPSIHSSIKGSKAAGSTSVRHCNSQSSSVVTIWMLVRCFCNGVGDSKQEYCIVISWTLRDRILSLICPAPGSVKLLTFPSNSQSVTPGTQSTRSGVPTISYSCAEGKIGSINRISRSTLCMVIADDHLDVRHHGVMSLWMSMVWAGIEHWPIEAVTG